MILVTDVERGLECSECLSPTDIPKYEISICKKCNYTEKKKITQYGKYANVSECSICNP